MEKGYEYHKRNDYPGERTAEKKRVSDKADAAERRSDARVAEKGRTEGLKADNRVARRGRMDDELMDSEIQRSTARAKKVNRVRDNADIIGLIVVAGILVIVLVGFAWGYIALSQQSDEISSLKAQIAATPATGSVQLSNANKQIQLYKDFLVMTADVKKEVLSLEQYNGSYSNEYQLCANFMERSNNINHAMSRFAEKEIIYYTQIAVLADKPECKAKIAIMNEAMVSSKAADEQLYVQNMNQCDRAINSTIADSNWVLETNWKRASDAAAARADAFNSAEKDVIACFA